VPGDDARRAAREEAAMSGDCDVIVVGAGNAALAAAVTARSASRIAGRQAAARRG
jgi:ribulose 1,5-bisphosphate synthetase/thiazole synthase